MASDDCKDRPMTDRLDEIRKRLGISDYPAACGYQDRQARADIAYLLAEIDNLTHDIGKALESVTLETEARAAAEAELQTALENGHKTWTMP